jgi:ribosome-binding protein aMBF1 (putative translation factor)
MPTVLIIADCVENVKTFFVHLWYDTCRRNSMTEDDKRLQKEVARAVGLVIQKLRTNAGLPQEDLAILMGVAGKQVFRWEKGETQFPLWRTFSLAKALNIEYTEIVRSITDKLQEIKMK